MSEPEGSAESFTIQARRGQTPIVCGGFLLSTTKQVGFKEAWSIKVAEQDKQIFDHDYAIDVHQGENDK